MDWRKVSATITEQRAEFQKSFKCLNKTAPVSNNTKLKHFRVLVNSFNTVRQIVIDNLGKCDSLQSIQLKDVIKRLKENLLYVAERHNLHILVPNTLNFPAEFDESVLLEPDTELESIDLNDPMTSEVSKIPGKESDPIETKPETTTISEMAQTVTEFIKLATSLLPEFDGKPENLQSFLDSLDLLDTLKGTHEPTAISLIKTKLKGHARNLISNEQTIAAIITQLSTAVKGESVEVVSAKLLNLQQKNKTANQYTQEVEKLAKALEGAYVSEGLSQSLANKYSTTTAVKAMTQNCSIDKVKLIMQAGTFTNMNDAVSKFVNSCTEITGQSNTVLYYRRGANNNNRGGRGYNRGRNYNHNSYNRGGNNNNNYNNRGGRRGQNRGRGRGNSNQGYNNNVRVAQNASENSQNPLGNNQ